MDNELGRVADTLPGLVWTALPDGQIAFLNQRWREYTGLGVAEAHGRGWHAAAHPKTFLICSHAGDLLGLLNEPTRPYRFRRG